jgi:hypothetical protein
LGSDRPDSFSLLLPLCQGEQLSLNQLLTTLFLNQWAGQRAWCCAECGAMALHAHGLCQSCYDRGRRSFLRYGGLRDYVLRRDSYRCRSCEAVGAIVVHHRRPAFNSLQTLITLCPACHAQVHRTQYPRWHMERFLRCLWRQAHPGQAEQLPLELDEAASVRRKPEQLRLIEVSGVGNEQASGLHGNQCR